jgi:hypothetical protein
LGKYCTGVVPGYCTIKVKLSFELVCVGRKFFQSLFLLVFAKVKGPPDNYLGRALVLFLI